MNNKIENSLIRMFQIVIVGLILMLVALVAADAWIKEDIARVQKLKRHFYEVSMSVDAAGPVAPTGVRPNYGDLSTPNVRHFQDAGSRPKAVK